MTGVIIADAGPLIALARVRHLDLLAQLFKKVIIPPAVFNELQIDSGKPGAIVLRAAIEDGWLSVLQVDASRSHLIDELKLLVDEGEAQAIILSEQVENRFLLIDERTGRAVAKRRGVKIAGVGAVLIMAKNAGFISSVTDTVQDLAGSGYRMSVDLQNKLKVLASE